MTTRRITMMGGDMDKIKALAVAAANHKPVNAHQSGNALYVRQPETDLPVPFCLSEVAKAIRADGEIPPVFHSWFRDVATDLAPQLEGHAWERDPAVIRLHSKAKADRLVTARYMVDAAELDGKRLAVYLGLSLNIYEEMTLRVQKAKDNFAKQHPDKQYKISMMSTPPVLYLKLDGYMLEGFAAVISGGVIEPVE